MRLVCDLRHLLANPLCGGKSMYFEFIVIKNHTNCSIVPMSFRLKSKSANHNPIIEGRRYLRWHITGNVEADELARRGSVKEISPADGAMYPLLCHLYR